MKMAGSRQTQATALVMRGLAAHKAGQAAEGVRCWQAALAADPMNKDALQLLGTYARTQGEHDTAVDLLTRSLGIDPQQPHVHNNLANCLAAMGHRTEALKHYVEALKQKPDYTECWFNRATTEEALGDHRAAEHSYKTCLRQQPGHLAALINLGSMLADANRHAEAEALMDRAFGLAPAGSPALARLLNNRGLMLKQQGRQSDALDQFRRARALLPDNPEITLNLANTLAASEQFDEALEAYRRVLLLRPLDRNAHTNMNKLLWQLERDADLLGSFALARRAGADGPALMEMEAEALMGFGHLDQALERIEEAGRHAPDNPQILSTHATIHLRRNQPDKAVPVLRHALSLAPDNLLLLRSLGEALLRSGAVDEAKATADRISALAPTDQHAVLYRQLVYRLRGEVAPDGMEADIQRLVHCGELPVPGGYQDLATFNQHLKALLEQLHVTQRSPRDQTLRNGTQTVDSLFNKGKPLISDFAAALRHAISQWLATLRADPAHPFLARLAGDFHFTGSWSSRLHDKGFHTDHLHPAGWLSGVYYVDVPDCVDDAEQKQGWLKFGQPNLGPEIDLPWLQAVQPAAGRFVLFPSYLWHGTLPFSSAQTRLTIAFDLVPRD